MPRAKGRPTKINAIVRIENGKPITARESILTDLRRGTPYDVACAAAGINISTYTDWLRRSARLEEKLIINPHHANNLTPNDQEILGFARDAQQAIALAERDAWDTMTKLGAGGYETTTRQRKSTPRGLEESVTVETVLPSFPALRWVMEHRYGRTQPIEVVVNGSGLLDDQERAHELSAAIRSWIEDRAEAEQAQAAIEVNEVGQNGAGQ